MKKTYLLMISIIGLFSLIVYSTYAMFTASVDVGEFVSISTSNLPTNTYIHEYERVSIEANDYKTIDLNITNSTENSLYYGVWYEMVDPSTINSNIRVVKLDISEADTIGQLASEGTTKVTIYIENNSLSSITVNVGVGYSDTNDLNLSSSKSLINTTGSIRPNAPKLTDGLIPVKYDTEEDKWVKANSDNTNYDWYNYENKLWANAVLVSDTNRSSYVNASVGTEIPESDVLAYYVWIPRYKYKVWNINKVMSYDSYDAETTGIQIVFERGTNSTGTITCGEYSFAAISDENTRSQVCSGSNGEYYTHPAFTFGEDELEGIWVGKFEMSSSDPTASYGGSTTTTLGVRIKPNVPSWRYNKVTNLWKVIHDMQVSNNEYGLTTDTTVADSHMMKNIEWGSIVYLTHSKYGVCTNNTCGEVYKNNSQSYITGNGGTKVNDASISGTTLAYNENKKTTTVTGGTDVALTMTNDATYPWTESDGIWSSGNAGVDNSTSTLTYNFTNNNDAVIKLEFSVSSYPDKYLYIYLDGTRIMSASDAIRGNKEASLRYDTFLYDVASGTHTLEARFTRTTGDVYGTDKAYIKSLEVLEGAIVNVEYGDELGGQMASTTYNESGIYDMNGGTFEFVMGNMSSDANSYVYNPLNAGTNFTYSNDTIKYIDRYTNCITNSTQLDYNKTILGDAVGEVVTTTAERAWNSDYARLFYGDSYSWLSRGGYWYFGTPTGIFAFSRYNGHNSTLNTTRPILSVY